MEIKTGDVVQLKSGGPKMAVGPEMPGGKFECAWFDHNELKTAQLRPEQLRPA